MKKERQKLIKQIIESYEIEKQEDLLKYLAKEGVEATQATVSRDIREMNLIKLPIDDKKNRQRYAISLKEEMVIGDKYKRVLQEGFLLAEVAQNLLIVKTEPGMAMGVAAALDAMKFKEIIGSIAGDDTIMIATAHYDVAVDLQKKIMNMI